jgi:hypothetical protein
MKIHWEVVMWNDRRPDDGLRIFKAVAPDIETWEKAKETFEKYSSSYDHVQLVKVQTTKRILIQKGLDTGKTK